MIPQAVILLGGKGTRIASSFPDRPKCLVPVRSRPFLEWQLDWLKANGIRQVLLAAGHMADVLETWRAARPPDTLELTLTREPEPRGTAGALKYIEPRLATERVLVLNGDSLTPRLTLAGDFFANLDSLPGLDGKTPPAVLMVTPIRKTGRYGTVEFNTDGFVTAFREKAERDHGYVNTGAYILPREIIAAIPSDRAVSLEMETFPALAAQRRLLALPCPPPLLDMGTPEGLAEMEAWLRAWTPP
ncbi:MAG: NTP transferase domain-containing protein [Lentisphaerae bacterium]|nr:NTP transferase domain-containing protein [Lentisphaerota bacterium]